jgi:hypothetical protein
MGSKKKYAAIIIDGPRGTGKSTLVKELCGIFPNLFPVKFNSFNFNSSRSEESSPIRQEYLITYFDALLRNLLEKKEECSLFSPIFDRMIGTDIVMSQLTGRLANFSALWLLDERWSNVAFQIILTCNSAERMSRIDRASEGDDALCDKLWNAYARRSKIDTAIVSTSCRSIQETIDGISSIISEKLF